MSDSNMREPKQKTKNKNVKTLAFSPSLPETNINRYHLLDRTPETGIKTKEADIYRFGIVFFEFWHRFRSGMERIKTLAALTLRSDELPPEWEKRSSCAG
ncbi:hypothetical protein ISN45_Aa01g031260 [Arabidopsis thaliana x Arabidopsis arenosa]|uniref:Protein kinase domain-containing protein n=1 Tax=Arabidopsis thaliana x Arabidopsis arenosa TaxID=1240361 RepID=A0A8T2C5P2_9BRAS|nr:hypothetical protein ISN45_Aa01g031260 [Arabidopsis thaliana x Arabidopsis arenosa]